MPIKAPGEFAAHGGFGLGEHEFVDCGGIVRDVQAGACTDFDDAAACPGHQGAPQAPHACDLAQPEKRVVQHGHRPQPRRIRRFGARFGAGFIAGDLSHGTNLRVDR